MVLLFNSILNFATNPSENAKNAWHILFANTHDCLACDGMIMQKYSLNFEGFSTSLPTILI
jgi:hypothetical protein